MAVLKNCMQQKSMWLVCLALCVCGAVIVMVTLDGSIKSTMRTSSIRYSKRISVPRKFVDDGHDTSILAPNTTSSTNVSSTGEDFSMAPELSLEQVIVEERKYRHEDNSKYLTCPTSVRKKIMSDSVFGKRYISDVPILMWDKHFNASEYRRLSQYPGTFGWRNIDYQDVGGMLKQMNSPNSRYMFDDRLVKGQVPEGQCIRCAIVGNGGILNGSKMGKEIDDHDYVFRVNTALTKGHEEDVGEKISFYCFTMVTLHNTLAGSGRLGFKIPKGDENFRYLFFADTEWTYSYLNAALAGKPLPKAKGKYKRSPMTFPRQLTADNVKIVHPDFERYIKWSWVNSSAQHKSIYRPTTGGIMVLAALHTCDEVNLYGYSGSYTAFSDHYYDKKYSKHVLYANHDYIAENKLWELLDQQGIVKLYKREKNE